MRDRPGVAGHCQGDAVPDSRETGKDRGDFARGLVLALAGEGRLQGGLELGRPDPRASMQVALYYIEDASVDVLLDAGVAKARLRGAAMVPRGRPRVSRSASFRWIEQDVRMQHVHHFMVQPFNTLVTVEGLLGHEDVRLQGPVPVWGAISFHASQRSWQSDFVRQSYSAVDTMLGLAMRDVQVALRSMGPACRLRALRKVGRRMDYIQSMFSQGKDQA